jgi:hypothetical protein
MHCEQCEGSKPQKHDRLFGGLVHRFGQKFYLGDRVNKTRGFAPMRTRTWMDHFPQVLLLSRSEPIKTNPEGDSNPSLPPARVSSEARRSRGLPLLRFAANIDVGADLTLTPYFAAIRA